MDKAVEIDRLTTAAPPPRSHPVRGGGGGGDGKSHLPPVYQSGRGGQWGGNRAVSWPSRFLFYIFFRPPSFLFVLFVFFVHFFRYVFFLHIVDELACPLLFFHNCRFSN